MVTEKKGRLLTFSRINKLLLLRYPDALLSVPLARKVSLYTMVSFAALYQLRHHLRTLGEGSVKGAIVEMGCWKGGCGAFMAKVSEGDGMDRTVWLFDSFEGLPELTPEDGEWAGRLAVGTVEAPQEKRSMGLYKATEEDVRNALKAAGARAERVRTIKGWFEKSVPGVRGEIGPIALLRLDGDTYDSTKFCLENLYAQVVKGGYVVVDDFHLEGCRNALYEFFTTHKIYPEIYRFPYGGRVYWRKE